MMPDTTFNPETGEFVREGTMLALPLSFPGQTFPPPAGETGTSAMAIDADRSVYIGTHGARAHLLVALVRQDTGVIFDIGLVPGASSVDGIAIRGEGLIVLGSDGKRSRLWRTGRRSSGFLVQEWELIRQPMEEVAALGFAVEPGAVPSADGGSMFAVARDSGEVLRIAADTGAVLGRWDAGGRERHGTALCLDREGSLWGSAGTGALWRLAAEDGTLERLPCTVPGAAGRGQHTLVSAWARDPVTGVLYGGTSPDGFLFSLDPVDLEVVPLGKPARQGPVACLAVGNDGRLFGMSGGPDDIAHLFVHDPARGSLEDLGVPISTLAARQYGYHFTRAVVGRDGEIYFGQDERVNQLWVYFPPVPARRGSPAEPAARAPAAQRPRHGLTSPTRILYVLVREGPCHPRPFLCL